MTKPVKIKPNQNKTLDIKSGSWFPSISLVTEHISTWLPPCSALGLADICITWQVPAGKKAHQILPWLSIGMQPFSQQWGWLNALSNFWFTCELTTLSGGIKYLIELGQWPGHRSDTWKIISGISPCYHSDLKNTVKTAHIPAGLLSMNRHTLLKYWNKCHNDAPELQDKSCFMQTCMSESQMLSIDTETSYIP